DDRLFLRSNAGILRLNAGFSYSNGASSVQFRDRASKFQRERKIHELRDKKRKRSEKSGSGQKIREVDKEISAWSGNFHFGQKSGALLRKAGKWSEKRGIRQKASG